MVYNSASSIINTLRPGPVAVVWRYVKRIWLRGMRASRRQFGPAVGHPRGRNRSDRRRIINAKPLFTRAVIGYATGGRARDRQRIPRRTDGTMGGVRGLQSSVPLNPDNSSCIL